MFRWQSVGEAMLEDRWEIHTLVDKGVVTVLNHRRNGWKFSC